MASMGAYFIARITAINNSISAILYFDNFPNNHRNTWTNTKFDVCIKCQAVTVIKTAQYWWYKGKNTG